MEVPRISESDEVEASKSSKKGKGVGKKTRASEVAKKTKSYMGVVTRRRQKQIRDTEANLKKSMKKLLSTGRVLIDTSSEDLIRSDIAEPGRFGEPAQPGPSKEGIVVSDDGVPSSIQSDTSGRWSFAFHPLYMRRAESRETNEEQVELPNRNTRASMDRVESVDGVLAEPQCSSTPNW